MIRDIYKNDDLNDLYPIYAKTRKEVHASTSKRMLLLHILFFVGYFGVLCTVFHHDSIAFYASMALISLFLSIAHFWINFTLFNWMGTKNAADNRQLEIIEKRISYAKDREFNKKGPASSFFYR